MLSTLNIEICHVCHQLLLAAINDAIHEFSNRKKKCGLKMPHRKLFNRKIVKVDFCVFLLSLNYGTFCVDLSLKFSLVWFMELIEVQNFIVVKYFISIFYLNSMGLQWKKKSFKTCHANCTMMAFLFAVWERVHTLKMNFNIIYWVPKMQVYNIDSISLYVSICLLYTHTRRRLHKFSVITM